MLRQPQQAPPGLPRGRRAARGIRGQGQGMAAAR